MDKENINKMLKKTFNNKNYVNLLIALLVIVFLWLATSSFMGGDFKNSSSKSNSVPKGAQEVATDEASVNKVITDYEEKQKEELKEILGKMNGVGAVDVMMYFESGEVKVPAVNSTTKVSEVDEKDNSGGTRTTKQEDGGSTVVMSGNNGESEPFIVQTYKPQITGIVIVAKGAEDSKIRYDIQVAVSSLYNLSLDKVNVYPMGS